MNTTGSASLKYAFGIGYFSKISSCILFPLFLSDHHFYRSVSHRRKLLLIFRHDISLHQLLIMMKIKGTHLQIPIGIPNLFQGKLKQTTVICLKLYSSFFFQNLLISCQKFPGRKSSLCMTTPSATDPKKNSDRSHQPHPSQKSPAAILHPPG